MTDLKNLGTQTPHVLSGADATLLEKIPNPTVPYETTFVSVTLKGDEFTSICPVTGGPDFGYIEVTYTPVEWIVESKSWKYYMESFRNEGMFHEQIVAKVCHDLAELIKPRNVTVTGKFKPRGGWAIEVAAEYEK